MRWSRKWLAIYAAASLSGVGISSLQASEVKSLSLWMPPFGNTDTADKTLWEDILKPFEAETGLDVELTIVPWDTFEEKYLTGVASGEGPDVGYFYVTMIGDYIKRGLLEPFDTHLSKADRQNYLFLDKGLVDGVQYSMPIVVGGARVIYYNEDILTAAGVNRPPSTWDEFESSALKVKAAGYVPFVQPWGSPAFGAMNEVFYPFLYQAGGTLFAPDGSRTTFNSPEGLKAAKFLYSLKEQGILEPSTTSQTFEQATEQFLKGKAAFYMGADRSLPDVSAAGFKFGIIPSLRDKAQGTFVASDTLVMFKSCPDYALCAKLTNFILSGPSMAKFHTIAQYPPIARDETYTLSPQFKDLYANQSDILIPLPVVSGGGPVYDSLWRNLQQMMIGQKPPADALRDAAEEGDATLASQ